MKKILLGLLAVVAALLAYLLLWPVPVDPATWDAPTDRGYVGDYAPNRDLAGLSRIDLAPYHGPEDIVPLPDGRLLTATQQGYILSVTPGSGAVEVVAETGGVPLGMEMGSDGRLLVADAHKGLLAVGLDGTVEVLTDEVMTSSGATPILYADDLDVAADGVVYFTDASTKFGAEANGATMEASLFEILESRGTGRVLAYNPADGSTRVVADGLVFPNGLAVADDGRLLVNITGRYQVLTIDPATGQSDVLVNNLPGFPDNINRGPDGTFLIGLVSPRSEWLDENSDNPGARKIAQRLPRFMQPQAQPYGVIVQIDGEGNVVRTFHDPDGEYQTPTGAVVVGDRMYVTSLLSPELGYRPYP